MSSMSVSARAVAERGRHPKRFISPKNSPGFIRARTFSTRGVTSLEISTMPWRTPVTHDGDAVVVVAAQRREEIVAALVDDDEQAIVHSPPPEPASAAPARAYFTCCLKNPSVFFHASSAAALLKAAVFSSLKN